MNKHHNGFTLLEVLISISIIALIAVVMLPIFSIGLKNISSSGEKSDDLFQVIADISSDNVISTEKEIITFQLPREEIRIPIKVYEAGNQNEGEVRIIYFKFDE